MATTGFSIVSTPRYTYIITPSYASTMADMGGSSVTPRYTYIVTPGVIRAIVRIQRRYRAQRLRRQVRDINSCVTIPRYSVSICLPFHICATGRRLASLSCSRSVLLCRQKLSEKNTDAAPVWAWPRPIHWAHPHSRPHLSNAGA